MSDELAPFFESRETRLGRLPAAARNKLQSAARTVPLGGLQAFEDQQFVSLWLSRRVGMPRKDVLDNFDRINASFFGPGATAATAYDQIAATYRPAGGDGSADPATAEAPAPGAKDAEYAPAPGAKDAEYAPTEGLTRVGEGFFGELIVKAGQSARSVGGGFEGIAQQVPAGFYSQAASINSPRIADPFENRTYLDLNREKELILRPAFTLPDVDKVLTPEETARVAKIDADMAVLRGRTNDENKAKIKAFAGSQTEGVAQEYRRLAAFWYELSAEADKRMGVDPVFAQTTLGQFMKSAGSVPATAALAALGPGGWIGMESMFYAQVESERAQAEGAAYDPQKAFTENLASAVPQMLLERALGVERLMNKVIADMPKMVGKVRFGDFAKLLARQSAVSAIEEGVEEPAQGAWNDYMASLTYDQKREVFTGEGAKRRVVEGVTGFILGGLFGGGITTLEVADVNRRVNAGQDYLTTKDGQPYAEGDFRVLRAVKSDQQILAQAPDVETGGVLLAAANGDKAAQADYNNRVLNKLFVPTEGQQVGTLSLGQVNNVPVVRLADGVIVPLDMTLEEDRRFVENMKKEVVRQAALKETVEFLQKRVEAGRQVVISEQEKTLQDFIGESKLNVDEAAARIGIAQDVNKTALPEGVKPEDVRVLGANIGEYQDGVYRDVSTIYKGGNALTAVEEVAEGYIKKRLAVGDVFEQEVAAWRATYEADTGTKTETSGKTSDIEWFSKRVVDYAVANRKADGVPASLSGFFRTLGEHLKTVFRLAQRLTKLKRDGKLDANFENHLKAALGMISPAEAAKGLQAQDETTMAAAELATMPEASDADLEQLAFAESQADFPKVAKADGDRYAVTAPDGASLGEYGSQEAAMNRALSWYLDSGSRGKRGKQTHNYVLFDEELVRIVEKNGHSVTFALAPAIDTPEFKAWFKDSKVVDAQGKPQVVYHGTRVDFSTFGNVQGGNQWGKAHYFTANPAVASNYAEGKNVNRITTDKGPASVMPVYLRMETPFDMDSGIMTGKELRELELAGAEGLTGRYDASYPAKRTSVWTDLVVNEGLDEANAILRKAGYDGIRQGDDLIAVFAPEQVKSLFNRGTFDATNPDITFALTGIPQTPQQALQAQAQRIQAKRQAATGQLLAAIQAGQTVPKRAAAVRRSQQASLLARVGVPLSTRLDDIAPALKNKVRQHDFGLSQALMRDMEAVTPFLRGLEGMKDSDAAVLDLALKNGDTASRDAILNAYGLQAAFLRVKAMLDTTRARAIAVGYEVGEIEDYFPRHVLDVDGLMTHYYGQPQAGHIEAALAKAGETAIAQGRGGLTLEERIEVVNTALRGYGPKDGKPSNLKGRKTDIVDMHANVYYADPAHALMTYIESLNAAIEKRRFFGKSAQNIPPTGPGLPSRINLDASIGGYVEALIAAGEITRAQQREVSDLLEARFDTKASSEFIKAFKTLGYITTMGKITSALTQIQDLAFSLYENGVFDTMVAASRAAVKQSKITKEALGLNAIADEFRDPGKLGKLLNLTFTITGLRYIDGIGKEAIVNAKFARMSREAAAGKLSARTQDLIRRIFPPADQARVLAELAAGKQTEDTLFAVYNVLADYQPIAAAEYPEAYLRHPNGRVFYMLKTYTIKQIDSYRREGITLIVHGNAKQKLIGFRNLTHMAALLFLVGVPLDWLKDFIMGRDPQLPDIAVDNLFKLIGVSRWNLWRFRDHKDPVKAAMELVTPPAPFLSYPIADVFDAAAQVSKGDDIKPGEFESWKILPFFGDPIYWLLGGGRVKVEKRRAKREKAANPGRVRNR